MDNLFTMLRNTALARSEHAAIFFKDTTITYKKLYQYMCGAAQAFKQFNIGMGDRVSLLMGNIPQFPIAYYGLQAIAAVAVPSNPMLKPEELSYIYNDAQVKAVVTIPQLLPVVLETQASVPSLKHIFVCQGGADGAIDFDQLTLASVTEEPVLLEFDPKTHPAVFMYTSGTTGHPKGCMLSHHNLMVNSKSMDIVGHYTPDSVTLGVLPLFHAFAATVCMHTVFESGSSVVIIDKFAPDTVLDQIEKHRVTFMVMVPTMYAAITQFGTKSPESLASCIYCASGGAPLAPTIYDGFKAKYGKTIIEGYGPTECSPCTAVNPFEGVQKLGSIGLPLPFVELGIVDDHDNFLDDNQIGEIVVRGENIMLGYYNMPEETAAAMTSGWYHTGDIGKRDTDGYYYILDRKKDMLLVGGLNVYPREVEEVILHHPAVLEAAVVGEADKLRGEAPVAFVVLKQDEQATDKEISKWCRQRIAAYKVPKKVIIREQLPKSATMKILKRELRNELNKSS